MQSLDRLDIDTPEQIALELPLAGIGSRFLALAIDSLLQVVVVIAVVIVGALMASGSRRTDWSGLDRFFSQTIGAIVLVLLPFCLYWGYFAFFEVLWQGRTPGKRVAGIRVIHQSGRPMTAIECIGRNLMRGVDILPGMYGVGLICMMCNAQNRRVGDFIAGTIVVHDKALETARGDDKDIAPRRKKALEYFAKMKVPEAAVLKTLGVTGLSQIGPDELQVVAVGEVRGPGRLTRVVIRILDGSGWVVDFDIAHAEITLDFVLRGDGQNLGVCLRQAQALIVDEEKSFLSDERAAE